MLRKMAQPHYREFPQNAEVWQAASASSNCIKSFVREATLNASRDQELCRCTGFGPVWWELAYPREANCVPESELSTLERSRV